MNRMPARDVETTVPVHAGAPATDRGMQVLEYSVGVLAALAALILAFAR